MSDDLVEITIQNDDRTTVAFVFEVLCEIFALTKADAAAIAMRAHYQGSAPVAVVSADVADAFMAKAREKIDRSDFPLALTTAPASPTALRSGWKRFVEEVVPKPMTRSRPLLAMMIFVALGLLTYALAPGFSELAHSATKSAPPEIAGAYQSKLLETAISDLLPSRRDRDELYFVSFGADGDQDVFMREARTAREIFDERMQTKGRSVLMINNPHTLREIPLATIGNLEAALKRLGKIMDANKDVLVLFITSHGSENNLSVTLPGRPQDALNSKRLSQLLKRSGIRRSVVIISACYSGSFIPALENKQTVVITAARADRASFGCSDEREWTYFGDAFFNHALRKTHSLVHAFELARETVAEWENRERLDRSEPQISVGAEIAGRLKGIAQRLDSADAAH